MSEHFDFEVIPSDDPTVRDADKGFLVEVAWTVTAPEGGKAHGVRRVLVPSTADAIVQLGSLYEPTEIPAVTAQRIISGGTASTPLYDIRIRHDDTAGWAAEDPILSLGEEGIDVDTGTRKVGDGVTTWSSLPDRLSDEADARAAADAALDVRVDALEVAPPAHTHPLADVTDAGTAAAADVGDFATAAQGAKADNALQPNTVTGLLAGNGTTTTGRTITGTADEITVTNGNGASGNPTLSLALTAAKVGALPIPDPGSFYPTDTIAAALQLIGGRERYGTGSPEGVVTAPVGTYYTDTAITNGAMRWAKKTGTGNTGWQVTEGDTGNRTVTSQCALAEPNVTTTVAKIRRTDNLIEFYCEYATGPTLAASPFTLYALPYGFRPGMAIYAPLTPYGATLPLVVYTGGDLKVYTQAANSPGTRLRGMWMTSEAWPTSLPGTAG